MFINQIHINAQELDYEDHGTFRIYNREILDCQKIIYI